VEPQAVAVAVAVVAPILAVPEVSEVLGSVEFGSGHKKVGQ
jgi:hypothetical protein